MPGVVVPDALNTYVLAQLDPPMRHVRRRQPLLSQVDEHRPIVELGVSRFV